ncbi:hypothetical protein Geob_0990 [Geotalea daltonii FRC-32]|uniref:SseB protein N-terminal domain-containing protein n=1 Tax=Geotalea daltonii (strain DSM 22248 / JCM 15807 / FRC-32) TaxID=316067 RepID=B9M2H3_GEODF|nr:SseB family protein [Geotalea daltonii]ACM19352.1 hypothetical protein Geob_0990 [Geotalea daltonii FRC-32]
MWPFKKKSSGSNIDVNKPVENPDLVAAIQNHANHNSNESTVELVEAIRKAVFLAAIDERGLNKQEIGKGEIEIQKGSKFGILEVQDSDNRRLLTLFTDWKEFQNYAPSHFSGLIMPSNQVSSYVQTGSYDGVVINPGGNALPIYRNLIAHIFGENA